MGTGQDRTHMIHVAKDMSWIATSNVASGTVSILDLRAVPPPPAPPPPVDGHPALPSPLPGPQRTDWYQTVIPVGAGAEGFDVSPDGRELWVASAREGTIAVVDVATRKVVEVIAAGVTGANRLKFSVEGHAALVSSVRGPT